MRFIVITIFLLTLTACSSMNEMAMKGDFKGVYAGLYEGYDINQIDEKDNMTLLGAAAKGGNSYMIKVLLDQGADIEKGDTYYEATPLIIALDEWRFDAAKFLISKGANVHAINFLGETPLHHAVETDSAEMVRLLLDKGADLFAVDDSDTLLIVASGHLLFFYQ